MTQYTRLIMLVVPAANLTAAQRIAEALHQGSGCFTVAISADGSMPATHWGLSARETQSFEDGLAAAAQGVVPEGVDPADLAEVMPVLLIAHGPADVAHPEYKSPRDLMDKMLSDNGLQRVVVEGVV